jgi:hypothetical protein
MQVGVLDRDPQDLHLTPAPERRDLGGVVEQLTTRHALDLRHHHLHMTILA